MSKYKLFLRKGKGQNYIARFARFLRSIKLKNGWGLTLFLGLVILLLAIFLRTYNLLSLPIFADEAIYVRWAQVMRAEPTLRFLPLSDGKQPLYMWVVMFVLKFFSDPLVAGRVVSMFAGMASLVGIFLLTYRLFQIKIGALLASLFYAVSPFSVFFDRMALVDSMLAAFGIWTLYFSLLTAQSLRLDFAMLTGFALGGAWLTKSPAVFFVLLLPASFLFLKRSRSRQEKGLNLVKLFGLWVVSWAIAFGMYNIQRLGPNFHLITSRNSDYIFSFQEVLQHPFDPFNAHVEEIVVWLSALLPWSTLLVVLLSVFVGVGYWRKYWREMALLGVWVMLPLLVQAEFAKVFTARYILFAAYPLFALAGLVVVLLPRLPSRVNLFVFGVLLIVPLYFDYLLLTAPGRAPLPRVMRSGYLEEWTSGVGIREVASFIARRQAEEPDKQIIVGTEGFFGTPHDALWVYLDKVPNVVIVGVGVSISQVHPSLVEAKRAGDQVYLVVNSTRFTGEAERLGLRLIESYPKAERPDGTRERLLLFEVTGDVFEFDEISG